MLEMKPIPLTDIKINRLINLYRGGSIDLKKQSIIILIIGYLNIWKNFIMVS